MSIVVRRSSIPVSLTVLATVVGILIVMQLDAVAGLWSGYLVEVQAMQRDLHRQLAAAMRAVQVEGSAAAWALVVLSFLYGVFHAAGPGHGKVVISTYILTQESQLRRGLLLSLIASLCPGFTAVVAVSATVGLLGLSMRQAQGAATDLETLSYGLVALIGLTLVASRTRHLLSRRQHFSTPRDHNDAHSHASAHQHGHDLKCPSCGHAHGSSQRDLDAPPSWRGLAGMVASIGVRPCSGAVLVLLVAYSLNLHWAGVAAVLAMSLGTAITVSLLATLSVYARKASLRLATLLPDRATRIATTIDVVGLVGGVIIFVVGALLLQSAWLTTTHPLQ